MGSSLSFFRAAVSQFGGIELSDLPVARPVIYIHAEQLEQLARLLRVKLPCIHSSNGIDIDGASMQAIIDLLGWIQTREYGERPQALIDRLQAYVAALDGHRHAVWYPGSFEVARTIENLTLPILTETEQAMVATVQQPMFSYAESFSSVQVERARKAPPVHSYQGSSFGAPVEPAAGGLEGPLVPPDEDAGGHRSEDAGAAEDEGCRERVPAFEAIHRKSFKRK